MDPFLVDSVYLKIMSGFMEDGNPSLSQIHPILHETNPCLDDHQHPSLTIKHTSDSSVPDKPDSGVLTSIAKERKTKNGSGSGSFSKYSAKSKEAGEGKCKKQSNNGDSKEKKQKAKGGFIHVRARRGEATDSHSLAERVRREKISEKMKTLQMLVPACHKVSGKALMLDEIISYVQSLQNQVEFLSMKIASVNPMFFYFNLDQDSFIFSPEEEHDFQENGNLLWDAEEQGQKFLNPSGFNENLCSFN